MRLRTLILALGLATALQSCAAAPLAPAPITHLASTTWRVVAVDGRSTPSVGDYSMRFDASGAVGARFGCNSMGGQYRLVGDMLTVSDLASTLMGCPEPAATFEREGPPCSASRCGSHFRATTACT
ncbi:MAG: META domain-containing protein [Sphingomicrobium sp.]